MVPPLESCPALVLNADFRPLSYFPLSLWSWQDSIKAVFLDRVNIVSQYPQVVRSPSFEISFMIGELRSRLLQAGARMALNRDQADVILSLEEAVSIVREIDSPAVRSMFDVHNAIDESEPHAALVDRYFDYIRHVHVNELDGKHCGAGSYDFKPVLETLRRRNYAGWVSLEAFDFTPGAERLANESLRHLESEIAKLPS